MSDLLVSSEVILDCINEGVYVCDRDRRIVYWSKSAARITGWESSDVLGRMCLEDILCHEDKDGHRLCGEEHCPLHRAMVTGSDTRVPIIVFARGKNNRKIPMQVAASPIRNDAGEIIGGVETFRDVSPMLRDLERAQKIQAQSLEQDLPDDPRLGFSKFFMPHDIVGGDYYAIRQLDEDRYGFLLADMEGHGVSAALYTMHLSALFSRYYMLLENPARFAAKVNRELIRIFGSVVTFATAICGVIDARLGSLRLTGAGGPTPLIVHSDWTVEKPKAPGTPFGLMEKVPYDEVALQLEPGDSMLLFSDGAVEIQNAGGEWLGIDGLLQILKSHNYPEAPLRMDMLGNELLKFSNDIRLPDDITLIEVRFAK
jgi:phosphoserine phosphatase RsbU/P